MARRQLLAALSAPAPAPASLLPGCVDPAASLDIHVAANPLGADPDHAAPTGGQPGLATHTALASPSLCDHPGPATQPAAVAPARAAAAAAAEKALEAPPALGRRAAIRAGPPSARATRPGQMKTKTVAGGGSGSGSASHAKATRAAGGGDEPLPGSQGGRAGAPAKSRVTGAAPAPGRGSVRPADATATAAASARGRADRCGSRASVAGLRRSVPGSARWPSLAPQKAQLGPCAKPASTLPAARPPAAVGPGATPGAEAAEAAAASKRGCLDRPECHTAARCIQSVWRAEQGRKAARARAAAIVRVQAVWRGRQVRRLAGPAVEAVRERVRRARSSHRVEKTVGYRTKSALEALLENKSLSVVGDAVRVLDAMTQLSAASCDAVVQQRAVPVLFSLMKECNRSKPHLALLGHVGSTLATLSARAPACVFAGVGCVEQLLELIAVRTTPRPAAHVSVHRVCFRAHRGPPRCLLHSRICICHRSAVRCTARCRAS